MEAAAAGADAGGFCSLSFSRFFSGGSVGQSSMRWSGDLQLWQRLGMGACGHLDARWFAKSPQLKHLQEQSMKDMYYHLGIICHVRIILQFPLKGKCSSFPPVFLLLK